MKKILTLLCFFTACIAQAKYNYLFICVDDLRTELNCYGASHIKSPNIDKLAAEGRNFVNHYIQVPTCGASRASMLTGRYPRIDDALSHSFAAKFISTKEENETPESFPHLLRRNGYYTISIGKVSHTYNGYINPNTPEFPYSWDERHLELGDGKFDNGQKAYQSTEIPEELKANQKSSKKALPYEAADNDFEYPDTLNTKLAIKKLDELKAKNQPFMLAIGYFKPHLPFNSPKKFWDMYDEDKIDLAVQKEYGAIPLDFGHDSGEFNTYVSPSKIGQQVIMDDAYARKIRHAYYACVSYTDYNIGLLMKALEEKGLADNTIVVLWGDHGWHLGDNAIWGKHSLFKRSLNSPLIIKVPNMKQKGVKSDSIVEGVDLFPTFCDLVDIEIPKHIDGKSLKGIIQDPKATVKEYAISFWQRDQQIGLHTKTESFMDMNMFSDKEIIAYFNIEKDPEESKSLAESNPERVKELRQEVVDFLKKYEIEYPFVEEKAAKKSSNKKSSTKKKKSNK